MSKKMSVDNAIQVIEDKCMPTPFKIIEIGEEAREVRNALHLAILALRHEKELQLEKKRTICDVEFKS